MPTLNICPTDIRICISRGDSTPMTFTMQDEDGNDLNITGFAYIFTVNTEENPIDNTNEVFNLTGVESSPSVSFTPLISDTDITPGEYFYDIQETDGAALRTVAKGVFEVKQDITK